MSTILVVDDSQMIRQQFAKMLMAGGHTVVEAADGIAALEKLREDESIRLILLDVNMPKMSGLELLQRLHEDRALTKISVLMVTTEVQAELVQQAKGLGAKGWLVKPVKSEALVAAVNSLVGSDAR